MEITWNDSRGPDGDSDSDQIELLRTLGRSGERARLARTPSLDTSAADLELRRRHGVRASVLTAGSDGSSVASTQASREDTPPVSRKRGADDVLFTTAPTRSNLRRLDKEISLGGRTNSDATVSFVPPETSTKTPRGQDEASSDVDPTLDRNNTKPYVPIYFPGVKEGPRQPAQGRADAAHDSRVPGQASQEFVRSRTKPAKSDSSPLPPKVPPRDDYNIMRFIPKHKAMFASALSEIQDGSKRTHWAWYIFPTAPYVKNGVEAGTDLNKEYALRDLPPDIYSGVLACKAFLEFPTTEGVNLRANYIEIMNAVSAQLTKQVRPETLVSERGRVEGVGKRQRRSMHACLIVPFTQTRDRRWARRMSRNSRARFGCLRG